MARSLSELQTLRTNALTRIQEIRTEWSDKLQDMPKDVENTLRAAVKEADEVNTEAKKLRDLQSALTVGDTFTGENDPFNWERRGSGSSDPTAPTQRTNNAGGTMRWTPQREAFNIRVPERQLYLPAKGVVNRGPVYGALEQEGFGETLVNAANKNNHATSKAITAYNSAHDRYNSTYRMTDPVRGGNFIAPEEWWSGILKAVDDDTFIEGMARKFQISATSLAIRTRLAKAAMIGPGEELSDATLNLEASHKLGQRSITPTWWTGCVKVSKTLINDASFPFLPYLMSEIAVSMAEYFEDMDLTGAGVGESQGLLTAASVGEGIDTSRDVTMGSAVFTVDHLIDIRYKIKERYGRNATWMFHRNRLADLAKLKTTDGIPLWRPSMVVGVPDSILGRPILVSEYMPTATTTGTYAFLFGDYSFFWVVYAGGMQMEVDPIPATNEIAYYWRFRRDAMPVMAEAFARGKYA